MGHPRSRRGRRIRRHLRLHNCGYELGVSSTKHLPPCPSCENGEWRTVSGGDAAADRYPDRS